MKQDAERHKFLNRLRILRSIDSYEVKGLSDQSAFLSNPYEYVIRCEDDDAALIFAALLIREKPRAPRGRPEVRSIARLFQGMVLHKVESGGLPVLDRGATVFHEKTARRGMFVGAKSGFEEFTAVVKGDDGKLFEAPMGECEEILCERGRYDY